VRASAAFSGLGWLAKLELILIAGLTLQTDFFGYQTLSLWQIAQAFGHRFAQYAFGMLVPLPLLVIACNLAPRRGLSRIAWLAAAAAGYAAIAAQLGPHTSEEMSFVAFAALATAAFEYRHRAAVSESSLLQAQIDRVALDAEVTRARLQVLRSQAEPHFLFNTLANVRTLARADRRAAAAMLDNFARYLSTALPALRAERVTLAEEGALIDAYLSIHQTRMGTRLSYAIRIPPELASIRIPSMMLLTLVENSIKHGLAPLSEGGSIELSARLSGETLELAVLDTGRGLQTRAGTGTGLANIRSRLVLLYGSDAHLSLGQVQPHGLAATISLPRSTIA
jgi:sensor histidine kinase YesM